MNREQIVKGIVDTIKAWQDAESQHGTIAVDKGNLDNFISEVVANIPDDEPVMASVDIDWEEQYCNAMREIEHMNVEICKLKAEKERLQNALINICLKI